jgi:hypothetical protein
MKRASETERASQKPSFIPTRWPQAPAARPTARANSRQPRLRRSGDFTRSWMVTYFDTVRKLVFNLTLEF